MINKKQILISIASLAFLVPRGTFWSEAASLVLRLLPERASCCITEEDFVTNLTDGLDLCGMKLSQGSINPMFGFPALKYGPEGVKYVKLYDGAIDPSCTYIIPGKLAQLGRSANRMYSDLRSRLNQDNTLVETILQNQGLSFANLNMLATYWTRAQINVGLKYAMHTDVHRCLIFDCSDRNFDQYRIATQAAIGFPTELLQQEQSDFEQYPLRLVHLPQSDTIFGWCVLEHNDTNPIIKVYPLTEGGITKIMPNISENLQLNQIQKKQNAGAFMDFVRICFQAIHEGARAFELAQAFAQGAPENLLLPANSSSVS